MGFSVPRRAGLPETNHIMWIVFVIHFSKQSFIRQSSWRFIATSLLRLMYPCIRKWELRQHQKSLWQSFETFSFCPELFLLVLCLLSSISYSLSHHCLSWLAIAVWSPQFNALCSQKQRTWFRSALLDHSTENHLRDIQSDFLGPSPRSTLIPA